jgi:hypothetical protein
MSRFSSKASIGVPCRSGVQIFQSDGADEDNAPYPVPVIAIRIRHPEAMEEAGVVTVARWAGEDPKMKLLVGVKTAQVAFCEDERQVLHHSPR